MVPSDKRHIRIILAPTEAGTHFAGQCKAPEKVLEHGNLLSRLEDAGYVVDVDRAISSDPTFVEAAAWAPAPKINGVRNEKKALEVMHKIRGHLIEISQDSASQFPLIIGGDCSISPAALSGLWHWHPQGTKIGLLYMDGDADFSLPPQSDAEGATGILDSMVMTHYTQRPGGLESMKAFSRPDGSPLINKENAVLFGFDPLQPSLEHWVHMLEIGYKAFTRPTVRKDPVGCARQALQWLSERVDVIYVHFDVDVIDCAEFPLGNYPHYAGLSVEEAFSALTEIISYEKVKGLIVTEINPNNDMDGKLGMISRVCEGIATGMAARRPRN
jgi:arginase